jgi:hypothetical protein
MSDSAIKDKLRKIRALAEQGCRGEAEAAKLALDRMLAKYELTLEDITEHETKTYKFYFTSKFERDIMFQCWAKIMRCDQVTYTTYKKANRAIGFAFTAEQYVDFAELFKYYKEEWKKEQARLVSAFIQKHRLFSGVERDRDLDEPIDPEELAAIMKLMDGLRSKTMRQDLKKIGN